MLHDFAAPFLSVLLVVCLWRRASCSVRAGGSSGPLARGLQIGRHAAARLAVGQARRSRLDAAQVLLA